MLEYFSAIEEQLLKVEKNNPTYFGARINFLKYFFSSYGQTIPFELEELDTYSIDFKVDEEDVKPNFNEVNQKLSALNKRIEEIEGYIALYNKARNTFFTIYHSTPNREEQFDTIRIDELKSIGGNTQVIIDKLNDIKKPIEEQRNKLNKQLPVSSTQMISSTPIQRKATPPKREVIVRLFNRPGQKERKVLGIASNGHLSLEVIDRENKKTLYLSLVTDGTLINPEEENGLQAKALKKLGVPTNLTFKGLFVSAQEEKDWWQSGHYESEIEIVRFDCSEEGINLNFEAIWDFVEDQLTTYKDKDYEYQLYTNNCSTVVVEALEKGNITTYGIPLPKFMLGHVTTPQETLNFCQRVRLKLEKEVLEKRMEKAQYKSPKERWLDTVNYFKNQIAMLSDDLIVFKAGQLDQNEIILPNLTDLEKINLYSIDNADEIIKIALALTVGVSQKIAALKDTDTQKLNELIDYFDMALQIIRQCAIDLTLVEPSSEEESKKIVDLKAFSDLFYQSKYFKHLPSVLQKDIFTTNRKYVCDIYDLFNNTDLQKSSAIHQAASKDSILKFLPEEPEEPSDQFLKQAVESEKIDGLKILFRAYGFHEIVGPFGEIQLTNTQWPKDDATVAIIDDSKAAKAAFNTLRDVGLHALDDSNIEKKRFKQAQNVLKVCVAPLEHSEFTASNIKSNFFKKAIIARCSINQINYLQKNDKEQLLPAELYEGAKNKLRGYLAEVYQKTYFDLDFSQDYQNKDNLLAKVQNLIFTPHERINSVIEFIDSAKQNVCQPKQDKLQSIQDFNSLKNKTEIQKPSIFKFWRWNERHQLFEVENHNKTSSILNNEKLPALDKYHQIMELVDDNRPSAFKFWRNAERRRYNELEHKAGLICLLEGFVQGEYSETMFIALLQKHVQKFPIKEVDNFIKDFKAKYIKNIVALEDSENAEHKETISLISSLVENWKAISENVNISTSIREEFDDAANKIEGGTTIKRKVENAVEFEIQVSEKIAAYVPSQQIGRKMI